VNIKARQGITDTDMLRALEYLRKQYPTDNKWGEWLARAYFEKGDMRRSLSLFTAVLSDDLKDVRVKSLLMAAESARLQGAAAMALDVLNSAHASYPAKVNVLNNLIYTLAQDPATLPRARQLLPKLLETPDPGFAVLDTVATVYLRSGEIDKANAYIQKALAVLKPGQYGVLETRLSAAEIYFKLGRFEEARGQLKIIQSAPDVPALVDVGARDLLQRLKNQK
jgi:tetratricopeptide (TPR) repeat protein